MAEVLLFHHILGLTSGVTGLADRLRDHGHTVHTPDLFNGQTFASIDDGAAYAGQVGFDTIRDQGVSAAEAFSTSIVYAGISMGVLPAQQLAQTNSDCRGAFLLEACMPTSTFGTQWPEEVPVQVHGMDNDPFFAGEGDIDAARALTEQAPHGELYVYSGDQHLFVDASLPSYDAAATDLVVQRLVSLLERID